MWNAVPPEPGGGTPAGGSETVILDACVVINLYASRRMGEILAGLQFSFAAAEKVFTDETLFVRRSGEGEDASDREPIDLQTLVSSGVLSLLSLANAAEEATFVALAEEMDDGEALTISIARHRGFSVATDDRKARRSLAEGQTRVYSTLELLRQWCDAHALSPHEITVLLTNIRDRGKFLPPRGDPLQGWWDAHVAPHH